MTIDDVIEELRQHKGEFTDRLGGPLYIRHKTQKVNYTHCCPLAFLCSKRGYLPINSAFDQFATILEMSGRDVHRFTEAADGWADNKEDLELESRIKEACL